MAREFLRFGVPMIVRPYFMNLSHFVDKMIETVFYSNIIETNSFNDPSQESSFLKEVGFFGRRSNIITISHLPNCYLALANHALYKTAEIHICLNCTCVVFILNF